MQGAPRPLDRSPFRDQLRNIVIQLCSIVQLPSKMFVRAAPVHRTMFTHLRTSLKGGWGFLLFFPCNGSVCWLQSHVSSLGDTGILYFKIVQSHNGPGKQKTSCFSPFFVVLFFPRHHFWFSEFTKKNTTRYYVDEYSLRSNSPINSILWVPSSKQHRLPNTSQAT